MTKKNKLIYKIITGLTLIAPMAIYLFLSATLFNVNADITVKNATVSDLIINEDFIYTNNESVVYEGTITYYEGEYGFFVDEDTIIKTDDGYFNHELEDIKATQLKQETSYKLPIAFVISALGVGIVFMVVSNKMQWYKKVPRLSALIGLATGTLILYMMDIVVSNLLYVFLVATISWALYCVEYMVKEGTLTDKESKKADSKLLATLRELSNG